MRINCVFRIANYVFETLKKSAKNAKVDNKVKRQRIKLAKYYTFAFNPSKWFKKKIMKVGCLAQ